MITTENVVVYGHGEGYSAFIGLSEVNTMWIGRLSETNKIIDIKLVEFGRGD